MRGLRFLVWAASGLGFLAGLAQPQELVLLGPPIPFSAPAIDREGQVVAFIAGVYPDGNLDSTSDLWVSNAGVVSQLTKLSATAGASAVTSCAISADGSAAAYVLSSQGGETGEIHTINVASGVDRLLTTNSQGCPQPAVLCANCYYPCVHDVRWTADGRALYVYSGSPLFNLVDSNGMVTALPIYSGSVAYGPRRVISDTGILVFASTQTSGQDLPGSMNIYVINLDGSGLRNVTQFSSASGYAQNAVISADGQTIAFESNYGIIGTYDPQIFAINVDGSDLRQLTAGEPAMNASLSADGSQVAFVQSGKIQVVATSGTAPAAGLTSFRYSTAQNPMMSDDGTAVAFTIGPSGTAGAIYQVPTAGGSAAPVYAPASLNPGGVLDVTGWVQPSAGSLASIYGLNLAADQTFVAQTFPLPPKLGGVSVLVNGQTVPVEAVTPWQINVQLPQTLSPGNATVQLVSNGVPANTVTAQVMSSAAEVFTVLETDPATGFGYWQAAAFHAGTTVLADAAHPAVAGETLETYGSGLGLTNPVVAAGVQSPSVPPAAAVVTPPVEIGQQPAHVTFAGLVPGLAGIYQINVVVPDGLASGQQLLLWNLDTSGASIFIQ